MLAFKHGDRTDLARPAAGWLQKAGRDLLRDDPLLVPVPLHWSRLLRRGYNQAALLAQALALRGNWDCCPDALLRSKKTPALDHKSRADRQNILSGVIRANPRQASRLQGRKVVLIDDVMTSGATLRACTAACQAEGARDVQVLVLARVNGGFTGV
ncbi:ComF family protein [Tritonibacter multivorans]|uniref:ComF family protein n=1 Tax=Tritonibacter multivorans TaxID=928856 RepID=UPI002E259C30|nr:phosphoribosyltransferase family protein [Tritonibacter multivorans]